MEYKEAFEKSKEFGQEHIFQFWEELSKTEKESLLKQVNEINFEQLEEFLKLRDVKKIDPDQDTIKAPKTTSKENIHTLQRQILEKGIAAISESKVGCLMVAGGQGSRLGFNGPKGCFQISPIKDKPLFQLFAEQIIATQEKYDSKLYWYIMTSVANDKETKEFFEKNNYFNLDKNQILFFKQKMLPSIDTTGKLFLKSKSEIFTNPDGTGGVYNALKTNGMLDHAKEHDVEYFTFVNVDNPLVEIFDPAYVGLMVENESEFGCKVVKKINPDEPVGLVCDVKGKTSILEYSNLSKEIKHRVEENGDLFLNGVNLNTLMIKVDFINKILEDDSVEFSVAFKKINHISKDGELVIAKEPNGYKFEKFVFDVMPFANNVSVIRTLREDEFAPVKNAEGNDSPTTSKLLMNRKAKKWMTKAGLDKELIDALEFAEISPLFALTKEDFIEKVKGKIAFYENELTEVENYYFE